MDMSNLLDSIIENRTCSFAVCNLREVFSTWAERNKRERIVEFRLFREKKLERGSDKVRKFYHLMRVASQDCCKFALGC